MYTCVEQHRLLMNIYRDACLHVHIWYGLPAPVLADRIGSLFPSSHVFAYLYVTRIAASMARVGIYIIELHTHSREKGSAAACREQVVICEPGCVLYCVLLCR